MYFSVLLIGAKIVEKSQGNWKVSFWKSLGWLAEKAQEMKTRMLESFSFSEHAAALVAAIVYLLNVAIWKRVNWNQ